MCGVITVVNTIIISDLQCWYRSISSDSITVHSAMSYGMVLRKGDDMRNINISEAEAINSTTMLDQLKQADHFYIVHYCKKRDNIEDRKCMWDDKSKVWETKDGKVAITCIALNQETDMIDGYRTFTNIFQVVGKKSLVQTSEELQ
mgnify:FL=1